MSKDFVENLGNLSTEELFAELDETINRMSQNIDNAVGDRTPQDGQADPEFLRWLENANAEELFAEVDETIERMSQAMNRVQDVAQDMRQEAEDCDRQLYRERQRIN